MKKLFVVLLLLFINQLLLNAQTTRTKFDFDKGWRFHLGDVNGAENMGANDADWRVLDLPHDWSVEGAFNKDNPARPEGGALPGGIGWYRKSFTIPQASKGKEVYIDFDGVYQRSDVWINGHHLGFRPNGYISFRYELTPYLNYGSQPNIIAVKVDNSKQPNSRWYSGSGIYRNVWLVTTGPVAVDHWGTFISTPVVNVNSATVVLNTRISNKTGKSAAGTIATTLYDAAGKVVASNTSQPTALSDTLTTVTQRFSVSNPKLWSVEKPTLYKAVTRVVVNNKVMDEYTTPFGIRYFHFDAAKGFFLNDKPLKILGVCNHHDLGCLGAAAYPRAIERQLQILKAMGCNAIRTSHNPPAPELLSLCDSMGFIVMDEAFDCWKRPKVQYDYHLYWDEWHQKDLSDQILRDRNHPSIIIWSIGNEIPEQHDSSGMRIAQELAGIVHALDTTRPITTANDHPDTANYIIRSGALDLIGYNYHDWLYTDFPVTFPGKKFIGTETTSALETRGYYDMPSDSIRRWPILRDYKTKAVMNEDNTVSAYDNVSAPWGSTHEETWSKIKKYDYLSGLFIWTGFDYLGEPTPYSWPSRSSYFGIIDLAGFPKDIYYMYQSEWTNKPVLHIFPHWNWDEGKTIDVWAYYNNADEVELFLNGRSLGTKRKGPDDLHVMWRLKYEPGTLKAISRKDGKTVLTQEIHTAGKPARIELVPDRKSITANGKDLCFVTVRIVDKDGNLVPHADNLITFSLSGEGSLAGVDNGDPVSHASFKANSRNAFNGLALAVLKATGKAGTITFKATADGLQPAAVTISSGK